MILNEFTNHWQCILVRVVLYLPQVPSRGHQSILKEAELLWNELVAS